MWEAVDLWASLYGKKAIDGERLLEQLGLTDKRGAWFMNLSGGQKQRLFIALALINDPEVVFLDELTTGLDPQARHAIWDLVRAIRERGKTVFLTTHLMEEAERLCDRVAIMEHGRIIDIDTPESLVRRHCPGAHRRSGCGRPGRRWPLSDDSGSGVCNLRQHAIHHSRAGRRPGHRGDPMSVGASDSGHEFPDRSSQP